MDGNLASIYSLIHAFLTKHSHTKAAQAVKKAAKEVVILKDDIDLEGPQLDEIIAQWKSLKPSSQKAYSESDSDSSTSSSSSSSSSSRMSSNRQTNKVKVKGTQKKAPSSESGSSESDSDSDLIEPIKAPDVIKTEISVPLANNSSESSLKPKSSSDSDDESSDPESTEQIENIDKEVKLNTDKKPKLERDSSRTLSSENTSSSCSRSNGGNDKEPLISPKRESSASTDSSSEAETPKPQVERVQVTKKRRTDRGGTAVTTATTLTVRQEETGPKSTGRIKGNTKPGRQVNERFRRVDPSKMEAIADNRYVAKVAPTNDYGQRAHEDLIVTRGQGFRKEKNKKKKGSYRGGEITMESHSFKFA